MIVYGHWMHGAFDRARALGVRGCWFNPDEIGSAMARDLVRTCREDLGFRFILNPFLTENRVRNLGGLWERELTETIRWLSEQGIAPQCSAIQYGDEFWSSLVSGSAFEFWPSLRNKSLDERWAGRGFWAEQFADRTRDLHTIWTGVTGQPLPPVGMSETGAVAPPEFAGQAWWGLDVYLAPWNGYYFTSAAVQRLYTTAWSATQLAIMPIIGVFEEGNNRAPSVTQIIDTYRPILDAARRPRIWSVGVFLMRHPGQDNPAHGVGRGVLDGMDASYVEAVRGLCAQAATWSGCLET